MGEYEPLHKPGDQITFTASADATGGQAAIVTGNMQVGPGTADSLAMVGHFAHDVKAGQECLVFGRGPVHIVPSSGGIAAAARVKPGASGAMVTSTGGNPDVGVALAAASGGFVTYMNV